MHDPLVVAFHVPLPWPQRSRFRDARPGDWRWGVRRWRHTGLKNAGKPLHPWWRPAAWRFRVAGRGYRLKDFVTVWHVEPGGADSGEVCKWWRLNRRGERVYSRRWAWHVWHWKIQILPLQRLRRFLLSRCAHCRRRFPYGYAPVSHQWEGRPRRWWQRWLRGEEGLYHHECSSVIHLLRDRDRRDDVIRRLVEIEALERGVSVEQLIETLSEAVEHFTERFHFRDLLTRICTPSEKKEAS